MSLSQNQTCTDAEQGSQQSNSLQSHQLQQSEQSQLQQQSQIQQQQSQLQQQLQQALQQQQHNQQQQLQQMIQQQQQQQQQQQGQSQQSQLQQQSQALQQSIQQSLQVSQAQAQAIVQAQAALQQQAAQSLQQQQQNLHEHLQAVQQQQIQAALQRQSATLQELQQQAQQQALTIPTPKIRMPRAKAYNKPRGRMTAYAFFVQTCREEHKKKHPDENVVFAVFSKKCAERWNTMSEKEKQRFHLMADQDKRRYDLEMKNYVPPKDLKVGRGRKRHQPKDPNAPKKSLSAFFWFCNDERSKVKGENPEYTMGDIAKELGRRWAAVDAATKGKYESLSEQDKARYDREMTAYKKGLKAEMEGEVVNFEDEDSIYQ